MLTQISHGDADPAMLQEWSWRVPVAVFVAACPDAEPAQEVHWVSGGADGASIDAWLLAVLDDEELRQQGRQLKKVELATV